MSIKYLYDPVGEYACFFNSETMQAFGPVFDCEAEQDMIDFWSSLDDDPRRVERLDSKWYEWQAKQAKKEGVL